MYNLKEIKAIKPALYKPMRMKTYTIDLKTFNDRLIYSSLVECKRLDGVK